MLPPNLQLIGKQWIYKIKTMELDTIVDEIDNGLSYFDLIMLEEIHKQATAEHKQKIVKILAACDFFECAEMLATEQYDEYIEAIYNQFKER